MKYCAHIMAMEHWWLHIDSPQSSFKLHSFAPRHLIMPGKCQAFHWHRWKFLFRGKWDPGGFFHFLKQKSWPFLYGNISRVWILTPTYNIWQKFDLIRNGWLQGLHNGAAVAEESEILRCWHHGETTSPPFSPSGSWSFPPCLAELS